MWRHNRQLANLFALHRTTKVGGLVLHPKLRNDFADQLSMTEKSHHRTLRTHNAHRFGSRTHVGSRNVTAAESQRHVHLCGHGVEVAARGEENSVVTYHEPTIQLR